MVYRRSSTNIRRPRRRTRVTRSPRKTRRRTGSKRTVASSRRTKPCYCPGDMSPGAKFALAQIDPFEIQCLGAKIPDSNTMPSIANADTDQINLNSGTAGQLSAAAFLPAYNQSVYRATPGTSVTWSDPPSSREKVTNLLAAVEAIRPVAHGIRMSSALAPTSATGFVHVGLSVESRRTTAAGTEPDWPKTVSAMTGLAHYKRFTLASLTQSPVTVINKWIDESAFRYDDPSAINSFVASSNSISNSTLNFNSSWATIIVMIEGAPVSQPVISFEHTLLSECLPRKDAFILGTQAAPNSPGTMSAVSQMQGATDFAHTEAGQASHMQQSLSALSQGAAQAGEQVFQGLLPVLQRAGYAATMTAATLGAQALGLGGVNNNPNRLALNL